MEDHATIILPEVQEKITIYKNELNQLDGLEVLLKFLAKYFASKTLTKSFYPLIWSYIQIFAKLPDIDFTEILLKVPDLGVDQTVQATRPDIVQLEALIIKQIRITLFISSKS